MTFDEAMRLYPGQYTEADRGAWNAAYAQTQQQNAAAQAADQAAIQQRAASMGSSIAAMGLPTALTNNMDMSGTGYGSVTQQAANTPPATSAQQPQTSTYMAPQGAPLGASVSALVDENAPTLSSYTPPPPGMAVPGSPMSTAVAPAANNTPPRANTTPTTTPTAQIGAGAYPQLVQLYTASHPGAQLNTPADQQAFNAWAGQVTSQFGVSNWEQLPTDFATRYNANGTVPFPPGTNNNIGTAGGNAGVFSNDLISNATTTLTNAAGGNGIGNSTQVQGSSQQGTYQTNQNNQQTQNQTTNQNVTGSTNTTGTQQTTGSQQQNTNNQSNTSQQQSTNQTGTNTQQQNQTGTSATTGTQQGNTQQQQTDTTTSTVTPTENLGLGSLISGMTGQVGENDTARSGFLRDVMETGGSQFGSQLDQGIRNSLTGPQMTGAGDSARARSSGYAAAQVGRNNLDQRLGAAQQLAGPTGAGTLVQQAQPLIGSSTSGTNTSLGSTIQNLVNSQNTNTTGSTNTSGTNTQQGTTNTTGQSTDVGSVNTNTNENVATQQQQNTTQNTIGNILTDITGQQNVSGVATGNSLAVGTGETPLQQTSGGGGCYVCSVLAINGHIEKQAVRDAVQYKLKVSKWMPIGYSIYGPFLARLTLKHSLVERLIKPIAVLVLNEELRLAGKTKKRGLIQWALHFAFHNGSACLGYFAHMFGRRFETRAVDIRELLINNGLYFKS